MQRIFVSFRLILFLYFTSRHVTLQKLVITSGNISDQYVQEIVFIVSQNHLLHSQKVEHELADAKGLVHLLSSVNYSSIAWSWMVLRTRGPAEAFLIKHRSHDSFIDSHEMTDKTKIMFGKRGIRYSSSMFVQSRRLCNLSFACLACHR